MLRTERGEGAREMQILSYKKLQSNYKSVKKFQKQQNWNTYVLAICGLTSVRLAVTAAPSWIHVPPSQATNPETNENRKLIHQNNNSNDKETNWTFLFRPLFTHRLQRRKSRLADTLDELEDKKSKGGKAKGSNWGR